MDNNPIVSVITPCYNQAVYLEDSINSLLRQTYSKWECIIINDGSNDDTEEVAIKLVSLDERIKYLKQENEGVSTARNNAIKHSTGKYLLPLDADDLINPSYIEEGVAILEENANVKIVYCNAEKFGLQSGIWDVRDFDISIMAYDNMIFASAIFRKQDWERVEGYSENLKVLEDWELWLNILKTGGQVRKIPKSYFYYRIHNKSKTRTYDWDNKEALNFIYLKHSDFFLNTLGNPILNYRDLQNCKTYLNRLQKTMLYKIFRKIKNQFG
jgi:glycosyltransferase involved in cell wall biosynthesis